MVMEAGRKDRRGWKRGVAGPGARGRLDRMMVAAWSDEPRRGSKVPGPNCNKKLER